MVNTFLSTCNAFFCWKSKLGEQKQLDAQSQKRLFLELLVKTKKWWWKRQAFFAFAETFWNTFAQNACKASNAVQHPTSPIQNLVHLHVSNPVHFMAKMAMIICNFFSRCIDVLKVKDRIASLSCYVEVFFSYWMFPGVSSLRPNKKQAIKQNPKSNGSWNQYFNQRSWLPSTWDLFIFCNCLSRENKCGFHRCIAGSKTLFAVSLKYFEGLMAARCLTEPVEAEQTAAVNLLHRVVLVIVRSKKRCTLIGNFCFVAGIQLR